jgi:maltose O-acetyltransferase
MNSYLFRIRKAIDGDQETLTELSFVSKRYWQYPEHYYTVWQSELTITRSYLEQNIGYLIEAQAVTVGYYSIVLLEKKLGVTGTEA